MQALLGTNYYVIIFMCMTQGIFLAMTICGVIIFPMLLSRKWRPKMRLAREAAAFAAATGGLLGLITFGLVVYSTWKMMSPMVESYEKFGLAAPDYWGNLFNEYTAVVLGVFLLAALMLIPRVRRWFLPFFLLTLATSAFYGYALLEVIENYKQVSVFARMAARFTSIWTWFGIGFLIYIVLASLYYFLKSRKLADPSVPAAGQ
ncbi:MAG: hypothetical protein FD123_4304 [Bacteroidetes bacterium]|nr:MAG: hypothetical protein FD123_4304 [Bacteroidota bacterium]